MTICYQCGKPLRQAVTGRRLEGVERVVGWQTVKMHKCCAVTFDSESARVTANIRQAMRPEQESPNDG